MAATRRSTCFRRRTAEAELSADDVRQPETMLAGAHAAPASIQETRDDLRRLQSVALPGRATRGERQLHEFRVCICEEPGQVLLLRRGMNPRSPSIRLGTSTANSQGTCSRSHCPRCRRWRRVWRPSGYDFVPNMPSGGRAQETCCGAAKGRAESSRSRSKKHLAAAHVRFVRVA